MSKAEYVAARKEILDCLDLTDSERRLIEETYTTSGPTGTQARIITEFYVAKTLEVIADRMIKSNVQLAESNDKYASRMTYLTIALLVAAFVEAAATAVSALIAAGFIQPR